MDDMEQKKNFVYISSPKKDWLYYTIDIAFIGAPLAYAIVFVYQAIMYYKCK
jgi:hypothetical protein